MKKRRLGRTGLEVSELVIGAGWVGGIMIDPGDETKMAALDMALDAGINWIDTAADYGKGASEEAIGRLLPSLPPARRPSISTKVRVDLEASESVKSQIDRSLDQSLERLGLPSVQVYQLHNRIHADRAGQSMSVDDALRVADVFDRHRDDGRFDFFGITALGEAAALRALIERRRYDTAQVYYNMINPSAAMDPGEAWSGPDFRGLLAACAEHDVGVMNIRIFAAGVLATDVRHGREVPVMANFDLSEEEARGKAVLSVLGEGEGTRAQAALRFALAEPRTSCIVLGLAKLEHLEEALEGYGKGPMDEETVERVKAVPA